MNFTKLVCTGLGKPQSNFTIFLDLKIFAENIHNDHLSLKAAKIRQRIMEDMIWKLKNNNSDKKNTRHTKQILFSTQKNITNEEKGFLLHLKMVHFHCLKIIHQTRLDGETVKWIHQNFKFRTLLPLF